MKSKNNQNLSATDFDFQKLYEEAVSKLNPRVYSSFLEAGSVAAAILSEQGNVYTGVCIDTAASLGMCAERNAVANMLTNGENQILKLVCVNEKRKLLLPCGACRELLMQLDKSSPDIQILTDLDEMKIVTLGELVPLWWGNNIRK